MQSTSNVLPSSGPTVREIRTSYEGCTTNNRLGFEMYQRKSLLVMVGAVAAVGYLDLPECKEPLCSFGGNFFKKMKFKK